MKVNIEFNGDCYITACIENKQVGNLDIYTDDDGLSWLNGIEVNNEYRRQGIATKMIKRAIKEFGEVYVSTASQHQHNFNNDDTARYLCDDGADLVNKLLERKVLKKNWMLNPFGDENY
jgi:GNAT superfamily N-acetyltransferase